MVGRIARDFVKSLVIGIGVSAALAAVLWLAGCLFGGFNMSVGWVTARSGLLIAGAFGLFVLAGSNLFKRGGSELEHKDEWKKHFSAVSYKTVLGIICVLLLGAGSLLDYFLYYV